MVGIEVVGRLDHATGSMESGVVSYNSRLVEQVGRR